MQRGGVVVTPPLMVVVMGKVGGSAAPRSRASKLRLMVVVMGKSWG